MIIHYLLQGCIKAFISNFEYKRRGTLFNILLGLKVFWICIMYICRVFIGRMYHLKFLCSFLLPHVGLQKVTLEKWILDWLKRICIQKDNIKRKCVNVFPDICLQVLGRKPHGRPADVYSLGCFLIELLVGVPSRDTLWEQVHINRLCRTTIVNLVFFFFFLNAFKFCWTCRKYRIFLVIRCTCL